MLPPVALLEPGMERVLDMASAPGSKTTQMAAMMANGGVLIANEYSSSRVKVLHANLQRMGVSNTALTHFDARVFGQYQYESMDAVLLDAPCSGEGTVRKDPDALKHWDPQEIADIAATQRDLIDSAFLALKPGGVMVYSTCTLNSQENQAVLQHLKQNMALPWPLSHLNHCLPERKKPALPRVSCIFGRKSMTAKVSLLPRCVS